MEVRRVSVTVALIKYDIVRCVYASLLEDRMAQVIGEIECEWCYTQALLSFAFSLYTT